jgi:hypothetical protein
MQSILVGGEDDDGHVKRGNQEFEGSKCSLNRILGLSVLSREANRARNKIPITILEASSVCAALSTTISESNPT